MIHFLVAAVAFLVVACGGKSSSERAFAELVEITAEVDRGVGEPTAWSAARVGDQVALGHAVRTGAASRARLTLADGGELVLDANAVVRFSDRPGSTAGDVQVEAGNVELEAGDRQIGIGEAVLEKRAKARLSAGSGGVEIKVAIGKVLVERDGKTVTVEAGQSVTVKIGRVVLEPTTPKIPADAAIATVDAPEAPEAPKATQLTVRVTGKPARLQTDRGMHALPPGTHQVDAGSIVSGVVGTTIEVVSAGGRATLGGPSELQVGGPDALVTVVSGTVILQGTTGDVAAAVVGGIVTSRSGGETRVQARVRGGSEVEGRRGEGTIRSKAGEELIQTGDLVVLKDDGTVDTIKRAPTSVVFSIPAGESAVVHDPNGPTPVGVRFGGCGGDGVVELAGDRSFKRIVARSGGKSSGNLLFAIGAQVYRVSCGAGKTMVGSISVLRDSGRKPLPTKAPKTMVEADGREYVITYQNLLPEIVLAWRDAPARTNYKFMVQSKTDAKAFSSSQPRWVLKSGDLAEGSYRFWVEIPETGGRSETTRIAIDFDNAQPTASIAQVDIKDNKAFVKGSVIPGSSVSSGGQSITLDRHLRFEATLAPQPGETGIAIRIAHPKLGVHYYVVSSGK